MEGGGGGGGLGDGEAGVGVEEVEDAFAGGGGLLKVVVDFGELLDGAVGLLRGEREGGEGGEGDAIAVADDEEERADGEHDELHDGLHEGGGEEGLPDGAEVAVALMGEALGLASLAVERLDDADAGEVLLHSGDEDGDAREDALLVASQVAGEHVDGDDAPGDGEDEPDGLGEEVHGHRLDDDELERGDDHEWRGEELGDGGGDGLLDDARVVGAARDELPDVVVVEEGDGLALDAGEEGDADVGDDACPDPAEAVLGDEFAECLGEEEGEHEGDDADEELEGDGAVAVDAEVVAEFRGERLGGVEVAVDVALCGPWRCGFGDGGGREGRRGWRRRHRCAGVDVRRRLGSRGCGRHADDGVGRRGVVTGAVEVLEDVEAEVHDAEDDGDGASHEESGEDAEGES